MRPPTHVIGTAFAAALVIGIIEATALLAPSARASEKSRTIIVELDLAKLIRLPSRSSRIIIGDPLIVRATPLRDGIVVLIGTGLGETNLIMLDDNGAVIAEPTIRVTRHSIISPIVHRGEDRSSYDCASACEPTVQLGDEAKDFDAALTQIQSRNNSIVGSVAPGAATDQQSTARTQKAGKPPL